MIAADTSSLAAYLSGGVGADVDQIDSAIMDEELVLPPPVLSELYSKPQRAQFESIVAQLPLIELADGFWTRTGEARRVLLGKGFKAALADALIAQCCIDADMPLITRDADFQHFKRWCGLKLA